MANEVFRIPKLYVINNRKLIKKFKSGISPKAVKLEKGKGLSSYCSQLYFNFKNTSLQLPRQEINEGSNKNQGSRDGKEVNWRKDV